jgi:hypothetical protein
MTEVQQLNAIERLAGQLDRLAHDVPLPTDEEQRATEAGLDLASAVRSLTSLCPSNLAIAARLLYFLATSGKHDEHKH